jgi:hypothetical protein
MGDERVEEKALSIFAVNRPCHAGKAMLYKFPNRFIIVGHQS